MHAVCSPLVSHCSIEAFLIFDRILRAYLLKIALPTCCTFCFLLTILSSEFLCLMMQWRL